MVENSKPSIEVARKNTGKTASLTPGQALEILQQSVINCQNAGITVRVSPFIGKDGVTRVVVLLDDVHLNNGNLVLCAVDGSKNDNDNKKIG